MSGGLSNISRRFFSLDPTNLSSTSGPLTTVIGRSGDSTDPICLANNVLPHPGLPYNKRPRTGWIPSSLNNDGGAASGVHILRLISTRTSSSPPIPKCPPSKEWPDPARAIICETRPAAISAAATCSGLGAVPLFSSPFTLVLPPPPSTAFCNSFLSFAIVAISSGFRTDGINTSGFRPLLSVDDDIRRDNADFPPPPSFCCS
mmetsp:Transcript_52056/g.125654  ORF Transcript_52056/g.125654 Transcript_52056/m.125654 type:complete len:203 (-) Transcript_52056:685-1293(-)